jgi:large subunit ribosomal protein L30e
MTELQDLRKALEDGKVIFGLDRTMKGLKSSKIKNIVIASNCPKDVKEDLVYNAKIANANIHDIEKTNEEIGTVCKKPFSILVLGW